jgi:hypothetical protein
MGLYLIVSIENLPAIPTRRDTELMGPKLTYLLTASNCISTGLSDIRAEPEWQI